MAIILDSLVGSIVNKVHDAIIDEGIIILGVEEDLKELQRTMKQVQCFLNDAEQRRTEESAVNNWLSELKEATYKADDIIDLARLEGNKLLVDEASSSKCSPICIIFQLFNCLPYFQRRHSIAIQIRNLNSELEKISKLGERFLKLHNVQPKEEASVVRRMKTCELLEPNLVGNETLQASTKLVELILRHKDKKAYKIGILGAGGVGKTTLAQKIYNDDRIKEAFSNRAWVCVSPEYSEVALLREVLRNIKVEYKVDETIGELSRKLAAAIEKKILFLVLDDIWQHEVWTNVLRIPLDAAATTIILMTTRNDTTAQGIGVEDVHRVQLMTDHTGWELLWKSMYIGKESEVQNLRDIGMDIVHMCGGLPLAIKVVASVLATKEKTENEWRKFRNKSVWSMTKLPNDLTGALYLSYDDLPRHLKQCFLYCTLYPEGQNMYCVDLIRFWIVEGFVEEQEDQLLEDTAEEYYIELINRNLLQPDPIMGNFRCRMHGLLRRLAQHLSEDEYFCGHPQYLEAKSLSKLRCISLVPDKGTVILPVMENEQIRARTFRVHSTKPTVLENEIFIIMPYIRVLDLSKSVIKFIPDYIGRLIHLRSLDLDDTDISRLPDSIGCLVNLQILNLQRCHALFSLPLGITLLCKLRRLGLSGTPINQVPKGIGGLKFLNDLEGFPVGHVLDNFPQLQEGWALEELGSLPQLRRLEIIKLEKAGHCTKDFVLLNKHHLKELILCCTEDIDEPYSEEEVGIIQETFEQLIPPYTLEHLVIKDFFAQSYPTWLGTTHLSLLKSLTIINCQSCVHLPAIGQLPNLKHLKICGATAVTNIGPEFVGSGVVNPGSAGAVAFPKLEQLMIIAMPNWEDWTFGAAVEGKAETGRRKEAREDVAPMKQADEAPTPRMQLLPCLKHLGIIDCPMLRALPQQLGQEASSLKTLELGYMDCLKVVENFPFLSVLITRCEGLERISNLPHLRILNAAHCLKLRFVEMLDNLQQLFLTDDMVEISSQWLPGLLEQCQKLHSHREDLEVHTEWCGSRCTLCNRMGTKMHGRKMLDPQNLLDHLTTN